MRFHTFHHVINKLLNKSENNICMFESRPAKYRFGVKNYGDIKKWINKADGDPWDVFAPGYDHYFTRNKEYTISKVIGIFILENGNHKIAVRIKDAPIVSTTFEKSQIKKYMNEYSKYTKINGYFVKI